MSRVHTLDVSAWSLSLPTAESERLAAQLEAGKVLYLPALPFLLDSARMALLNPALADPKSKNLSYDGERGSLSGTRGSAAERAGLLAMLADFRRQALGLIEGLFPSYSARLRIARTSLRPVAVEGRPTSWRKDDSRLHVDAFPSRPNRGERILRVFSNVNPQGQPRVWRVGEPFEDLATRFLPLIGEPLPGTAVLVQALGLTKSRRSAYDHYMLGLHDCMKADREYQRVCPQETVHFAAGSTWICFSDQTAHAAMSGQYLFEQTLHLPVEAMYQPARSPLRILERIAGRPLA